MSDTTIAIRKTNLCLSDLIGAANRLIGIQFLPLVGLSTLTLLAISAVPLVLDGPLMIGLVLCYQRLRAGKNIGIETLFEGFQFFKEGLIARLILFGIQLLCTVMMIPSIALIMYGTSEHHDGIFVLGLVTLCAIAVPLGLYVTVHCGLSHVLIAEHKLKGVDAVKLAGRGILTNPIAAAKLALAVLVLTFLGYLACGVGVLIAFPFSHIMIWLASSEMFERQGADAVLPASQE